MNVTRLVPPAEVAKWLGVKPKTLANWRTNGKGPKFVKQGGSVWYDETDLESWKAENKFTSTSDATVKGEAA